MLKRISRGLPAYKTDQEIQQEFEKEQEKFRERQRLMDEAMKHNLEMETKQEEGVELNEESIVMDEEQSALEQLQESIAEGTVPEEEVKEESESYVTEQDDTQQQTETEDTTFVPSEVQKPRKTRIKQSASKSSKTQIIDLNEPISVDNSESEEDLQLLGKRSAKKIEEVNPEQKMEILTHMQKKLKTQERISRSNKATPLKQPIRSTTKKSKKSRSEKNSVGKSSDNKLQVIKEDSVMGEETPTKLEEDENTNLLQHEIPPRTAAQDMADFHSRKPNLSPQKSGNRFIRKDKIENQDYQSDKSEQNDDETDSHKKYTLSKDSGTYVHSHTETQNQTHLTQESRTVVVEQTPRKKQLTEDHSKFSFEDYCSVVKDKDGLDHVIRYIKHRIDREREGFKEIGQNNCTHLDVNRLLNDIEGVIITFNKSRHWIEANNKMTEQEFIDEMVLRGLPKPVYAPVTEK